MQFKHLFLTITFLFNILLTGFAQEPTLLEHGGAVRTVAFSPVDSQLVASAGENNTIKLWNLRNGTARTLKGHTDVINSIAFSPNGRLLASVSHDRTIKLWTVHNQNNIATLRQGTQFVTVAFSPDGKLLATGGWRHVILWDVGPRKEIATLLHDQFVQTVAFSSDGELLAVGDGSNDGPGSVKVWNVQNQKVIATLEGDPKLIRTVRFSSDNRILASSGWHGQVKIWDASNWELLRTIPDTGYNGVALSSDGKLILSADDRDVNLWWAEDGTNVYQQTFPAGGLHTVGFSHDGTSFAVGGEDGIIRVWRINTSLADSKGDGIQILHIDTYFQQLPRANSTNGDNIPDPVSPPSVVREFFELDPYYEQWINVRGLPIIAPAKVNPYAVKEAAWVIEKMIGHRPDVLRAMVSNRARFSVVAHTDIITEIPEYRDVGTPDFLAFWARGGGGSEGATVTSSEESILAYPGEVYQGYSLLLHEFAHGIHLLGLNTLDPTFNEQLKITYEGAMKNGLWQGTYATSDEREYWAEGTHAWFYPNGPSSFSSLDPTHHSSRQALKKYDPELATLLAEVYGDRQWRYTPVETRTHLPHLQGFNPQDSPIFEGWSELEETYRQLKNPNSDGNGAWANLKLYDPNQLSHLTKSSVLGDQTTFVCVNLSQTDVLLYRVYPDGTEEYWTRVPPDTFRVSGRVGINEVWLIKDANDRNLALFQTVENAGRALIGSPPQKTVSEPQVLIAQSQRPPMYWIDTRTGTLHRLVGAKVETLVPSVRNATSLAVDVAGGSLYWTEKTSDRIGKIRRANLDGTNVQLVKDLTSAPHSIAIDTTNGKLYLTNAWGKIQRLNFDGSGFEPNLITDLNAPKHLALDVAGGKLYWTETAGRIRRANLNGSNLKTLATGLGVLNGLAIANGKLYWTEQTGKSAGRVRRANLDGSNIQTLSSLQSVPLGIAVDAIGRKLYWTNSRGKIKRANLNGSNIRNLVVGLGTPAGIALSILRDKVVTVEASLDKITGPWLWMIVPTKAGQGGANSANADSLAGVSSSTVTETDVATNGAAEGDAVGDLVWTLGEISATGSDNVNNIVNKIGLGKGNVDDHSIYGLITLESVTAQSGVTMRAGSDDSIKIWLNGEVVHNNPINRGAENFQDTFKVDLVAGDNLLLVKVSERSEHWTMFVGIDADVNTVYKRPPDPVPSVDVNGDGVVNILDLVLISANFGKTGQNPADVNGDGIVNIVDLVKVAGEMGTGAAAPSALPQTLEILTATDVRHWLRQAQHADLTDTTSQRGILMLEQLLAALVPKETSLLSNYPNPFNPETWIPYQLSEPAEVTLHIYAIDGRLIRTVALGHQPVGMYQSKSRAAHWDGRNEIGEPVASGVYFYTLTAGEFTATRKMLIRK